jgi:cob(I)alamin adenosyltransferase
VISWPVLKIYTKAGDQGDTGLASGQRVFKDDPLLEACGTIDELNGVLGIARAEPLKPGMDAYLETVQHELFDVGADLVAPWEERDPARTPVTHRLDAAPTRRLEMEIDRMEETLAPIRQFILPGGTRAAGLLHSARTVCRRAERRVVALKRQGRCNPEVAIYLNRLADWLFVLARTANRDAGAEDVIWKRTTGRTEAP